MSVKYAIKELLIRRHRTVVTCIGIAVSVALVISLYSLSNAYKAAVRQPFEASGVDFVIERPKAQSGSGAKTSGVILPDSATAITYDEVQRLLSIDGIESLATALQVWSFDKGSFKVISGINPDGPDIGPVMFVNWIKDGRFFDPGESGVAVVEKHYASSYRLKVNDDIEISGKIFKIIGTVEVKEGSQLSAPNYFLPIDDVRRLAGVAENNVNAIYIRLSKAADAKIIIDNINRAISGVKISSPDSSLSVADSLFSLSERFTWLISIVIAVIAVFLILKTVSANISERTKEIGIMKAVGWTSGYIRRQLTIEMFIQAILGAMAGIIAGVLLSYALSLFKINAPLPWQGSPIPGSLGMSDVNLIPLKVSISPLFILTVFVVTVLITLLCGLLASKKANVIKPAEALRKI
jgi:putative ABC transport system permease protein